MTTRSAQLVFAGILFVSLSSPAIAAESKPCDENGKKYDCSQAKESAPAATAAGACHHSNGCGDKSCCSTGADGKCYCDDCCIALQGARPASALKPEVAGGIGGCAATCPLDKCCCAGQCVEVIGNSCEVTCAPKFQATREVKEHLQSLAPKLVPAKPGSKAAMQASTPQKVEATVLAPLANGCIPVCFDLFGARVCINLC